MWPYKTGGLIREVDSLEIDNLVVMYYFTASEWGLRPDMHVHNYLKMFNLTDHQLILSCKMQKGQI